MTNLAHKDGGLLMKSGGLATSCSCCTNGLCFICNGCDIVLDHQYSDERTGGYGYYREAWVTDPNPSTEPYTPPPSRSGPYSISWKTGYPGLLACYFWFRNEAFCRDNSNNYKFVNHYRLFSCENGVLVNRTNDAVNTARHYRTGADVSVTNTVGGYAIVDVYYIGSNPGSPACPTDVEDYELLEPEVLC